MKVQGINDFRNLESTKHTQKSAVHIPFLNLQCFDGIYFDILVLAISVGIMYAMDLSTAISTFLISVARQSCSFAFQKNRISLQ